MSHSQEHNIEIVKNYFKALQENNIPEVINLMDQNIVWHQPGSSIVSGVKKGVDQVMATVGKMFEISENSFKIHDVNVVAKNEDLVIASLHFQAKDLADNRKLNQRGFDLFKVANGKIIEVWLFSTDQDQEDNYWGQ